MKDEKNHLYAKDCENLQIPYDEYLALMEKVEEAKRLQEIKVAVVADLQHFIGDGITNRPVSLPEDQAEPEPQSSESESVEPELEDQADSGSGPCVEETPKAEKVSVDFPTEEPGSPKQQPVARTRADTVGMPPIKNEIVEHFNKLDESGRLFNVFKQYYTCLNEVCGGTVRVTIKDGFCSLWNYDEWEEFAFVDIFEGLLRIAMDTRYTDALKSLSLCEAPRLISSRRNVICVQVDDLNRTVLDILAKAFSEVGMQVG